MESYDLLIDIAADAASEGRDSVALVLFGTASRYLIRSQSDDTLPIFGGAA